jgi:hypothetical protein
MVILDALKWSTTLDESFQPEPYPSLAHGHFDEAVASTILRKFTFPDSSPEPYDNE